MVQCNIFDANFAKSWLASVYLSTLMCKQYHLLNLVKFDTQIDFTTCLKHNSLSFGAKKV